MKKKQEKQSINTFVGSQTSISGTIQFEGAIRLDGHFEGKICSKDGFAIIGKHAKIQGDMVVKIAMVMGEVHGTIIATERIEIHPPGKMVGDIKAPQVLIDPGVFFNGRCIVTNDLDENALNELPNNKEYDEKSYKNDKNDKNENNTNNVIVENNE